MVPAPVCAQDLRYLAHQAWGTAEGLPQSSVHAIAQTPDGFLWVATEGGLARYDGVQIVAYDRSSLPAMPSADLCCLAVAGDGTLWSGTGNGLLALRNGRPVSLPHGAPFDGVAIDRVRTLPGDVVEVTTSDHAVYTVTTAKAELRSSEPALEASGVLVTGRVGSEVSRWHADRTGVSRASAGAVDRFLSGRELPPGRVQAVCIVRGRAWVAMSTGLVLVDPATRRAQPVAPFAGRSVLSLLEDREGDIWVGTETSGLHVLRPAPFRAVEGTSDLAVTALAAGDGSDAVLGTRGSGLQRWREGSARALTSSVADSAAAAAAGTILALSRSPDGALWAGTPDGIFVVPSHGASRLLTSTEGLPDDEVRSLAAISATQAWAGTAHGLAWIDGAAIHVFTPSEGLGGNLVGALLPARGAEANAVWAATEGGLSLVTPAHVVRTFGVAAGLDTPVVAAMAYDDSGRLWFATQDATVWMLDRDAVRRVAALPWARGRAPLVQSMTVAWGSLWMQTSDRIVRSPLARLLACGSQPCADADHLFTVYGAAEGMPGAETVAVASGSPLLRAEGELWFPTRGGVAATTEAAVRADGDTPVAIERITADDREIGFEAPLRLAYGRTRLSFEYAGLSLRNPRGVRYRYQLQGFDHGWIDGDTRRLATYTALPPGQYAFRVQAALQGEPWSAQEASVTVTIAPPFYRRWWFLLLAAILATLVAVLVVRAGYLFRVAQERQRFALVLGERNRLAREVHDTLAQDLVSTTLQLDLAMMQLRQGKVERAMEQLRGLRRFVAEGLTEARQSITELRDGSLTMDLPARVRRLAERNPAIADRTTVRVEGTPRALAAGVEREVARILGEALNNIAKHAQATAVHVTLRYTPTALEVDVVDDGCGFELDSKAAESGHFGLRGMSERAGTLGAELAIETAPGSGATVHLIVRDRENEGT